MLHLLSLGILRGHLDQTGSPPCPPIPQPAQWALPATQHKHGCPAVTYQLCCLASCGEQAFHHSVSCLALLSSLSHLSDLWSSTLSWAKCWLWAVVWVLAFIQTVRQQWVGSKLGERLILGHFSLGVCQQQCVLLTQTQTAPWRQRPRQQAVP